MRFLPRSRFAVLLWVASLLAILTVACGADVEPPPPGARLVESGPADAVAQPPTAGPALAAAAASPPPATTPVAAAPAVVSSPVASVASPGLAASAGNRRATVEATFLVTNTLGRGMALRPAPVSREPGKPWPDGTRMVGLGAEQEAYGWTWRWVRDPDGNVGWMPSNYLIQDETAPGTASDSTAAPPAAPPTLIIVPIFVTPESTPTGVPTPRPSPVTAGALTVPADSGTVVPAPTVAAPATTAKEGASPPSTNWALAFDKLVTTDRRIVSNDSGVTRTQTASGKYQRIYFRLQNRQKQTSPVTSSAFTLTDAQGRTYTSDFELRQLQPEGGTSEYSGASVAPSATVALAIDFDVATDATGLVLHLKGGNDIKVVE